MAMRTTDQHYASVQVDQKAAFRAADLVEQDDVDRASETNPTPMKLNLQIEDEVSLLDRTIPKTIEIRMDLDPELKMINADSTQIDQIVLNLAINARDAMPEGGMLTLRARNVTLDEDYCSRNTRLARVNTWSCLFPTPGQEWKNPFRKGFSNLFFYQGPGKWDRSRTFDGFRHC